MSFRFVSLFLFIQLFIQQSKWSHKCQSTLKLCNICFYFQSVLFLGHFVVLCHCDGLLQSAADILRRHGFSGQHGHGPTGKTEASVKKATEEWNLASHEQEYLTCSTAKKKKRRQVEIQLATFSAYRLYLLCTASRYRVLKDLLSVR